MLKKFLPLAILILVVHFVWLILIKFNVYATVHCVVVRKCIVKVHKCMF